MKILAIVNPISGGIDKEPFLKHMESELSTFGIDYRIYRTTGKNDGDAIRELVKAYSPERILSLGGDGTTLFTAQHTMDFNIPMGIIPFGSANGMAVELGVNPDQKIALSDFLKSYIVKGLDLIKVNDQDYCLHIGDIGINAQIVKGFSEDKSRGMITYAKHFLKELEVSQPIKFHIEADDLKTTIEGHMLAIANSRKYGTGVILNNQGTPFDGAFEIVVVKQLDASSLIKSGLTRFDESFYPSENSETFSCKKATVKMDKEQVLQLDGEVIGPVKEINLEIMTGAIQLITSKLNPFVD